MDFLEAVDSYTAFLHDKPLTRWISQRERALDDGNPGSPTAEYLSALRAAFTIKRSVGELNTFIHAVGILGCLPSILEPGERILSLSLGAGSSGKDFDLETDSRVAEFKFITWKGADTVRQNGVFADLVKLSLHPAPKRKVLYLTGADLALKFLQGGRSVASVLSSRVKLRTAFTDRFGHGYAKVGDFYRCELNTVEVVDLNDVVPGLSEAINAPS